MTKLMSIASEVTCSRMFVNVVAIGTLYYFMQGYSYLYLFLIAVWHRE